MSTFNDSTLMITGAVSYTHLQIAGRLCTGKLDSSIASGPGRKIQSKAIEPGADCPAGFHRNVLGQLQG